MRNRTRHEARGKKIKDTEKKVQAFRKKMEEVKWHKYGETVEK